MEYYDEKILEMRREKERKKYTTLETGIYVGDELITFQQMVLPDIHISIYLPERFVPMPEIVKNAKYPSRNAPDHLFTSLDSMVNFGFSRLPVAVEDGDIKAMARQFRNVLCNVNPAIKIKNRLDDGVTSQGNELCRFDFRGYALDGQSYNRMYLIRLRRAVLHGIFNCPDRNAEDWKDIVELCFMTVEEKET